jgi:ribonuclease-3
MNASPVSMSNSAPSTPSDTPAKLPDTSLPALPLELTLMSDALREQAFTHRSLRARHLKREETNERLEFLGDAVLELIVSEYLYTTFPHGDEGKMTRYRAAFVKTESLALVASELNLGAYIQTNLGEEVPTDTQFPSILADTFEAVLGALYLDSGYEACRAFVNKYLIPYRNTFITALDAKDPKSVLQEKLQAAGLNAPEYIVVKEVGPDHAKTFVIEVIIPEKKPVKGEGSSKQRAEQAAAEAALLRYFPDRPLT